MNDACYIGMRRKDALHRLRIITVGLIKIGANPCNPGYTVEHSSIGVGEVVHTHDPIACLL